MNVITDVLNKKFRNSLSLLIIDRLDRSLSLSHRGRRRGEIRRDQSGSANPGVEVPVLFLPIGKQATCPTESGEEGVDNKKNSRIRRCDASEWGELVGRLVLFSYFHNLSAGR